MQFEIQKFKQTKIKQEDINIEENIELAKEFRIFTANLRIDNRKAVGLAIPQCGINKRICIVKNMRMKKWIAAINPKIVQTTGKLYKVQETCLSWPNMTFLVMRYPTISVAFYDVTKKQIVIIQSSGFQAQIWQHELDHLNGVIEK